MTTSTPHPEWDRAVEWASSLGWACPQKNVILCPQDRTLRGPAAIIQAYEALREDLLARTWTTNISSWTRRDGRIYRSGVGRGFIVSYGYEERDPAAIVPYGRLDIHRHLLLAYSWFCPDAFRERWFEYCLQSFGDLDTAGAAEALERRFAGRSIVMKCLSNWAPADEGQEALEALLGKADIWERQMGSGKVQVSEEGFRLSAPGTEDIVLERDALEVRQFVKNPDVFSTARTVRAFCFEQGGCPDDLIWLEVLGVLLPSYLKRPEFQRLFPRGGAR